MSKFTTFSKFVTIGVLSIAGFGLASCAGGYLLYRSTVTSAPVKTACTAEYKDGQIHVTRTEITEIRKTDGGINIILDVSKTSKDVNVATSKEEAQKLVQNCDTVVSKE